MFDGRLQFRHMNNLAIDALSVCLTQCSDILPLAEILNIGSICQETHRHQKCIIEHAQTHQQDSFFTNLITLLRTSIRPSRLLQHMPNTTLLFLKEYIVYNILTQHIPACGLVVCIPRKEIAISATAVWYIEDTSYTQTIKTHLNIPKALSENNVAFGADLHETLAVLHLVAVTISDNLVLQVSSALPFTMSHVEHIQPTVDVTCADVPLLVFDVHSNGNESNFKEEIVSNYNLLSMNNSCILGHYNTTTFCTMLISSFLYYE